MSDRKKELLAVVEEWMVIHAPDFRGDEQLVEQALWPWVQTALNDARAEAVRDVAHQYLGGTHVCARRLGFIDGLPATCGLPDDHPVHAWPAQPYVEPRPNG